MNRRLRTLRKHLDLTQNQFAAALHIKQATVASYENGRITPSDSVISGICRDFNVNEIWLRTGEGEMFAPAPNTEMELLAKKYNLTDDMCLLVERIVSLKPEFQTAVLDFIMDTATILMNRRAAASVAPAQQEVDIEAAVADYRRQLELEASQAAGSAASPTSVGRKDA